MNTVIVNRGGIMAFLCLFSLFAAKAFCGEAPPTEQASPINSLFGPGSSLQADGEFTMVQDDKGEMDTFHAVDNVQLSTKDLDLTCDEMNYDKDSGKILATAGTKGRVHITMRGASSPGPNPTGQGSTRATCGRYELFVNEKRHILTQDPIIYQRDKDNKETMIKGQVVELAQDKNDRWKMTVKKRAWMGPPDAERDRLREKKGLVSKPTLNLDSPGLKPTPESPKVASESPKGTRPTRAARLDEGNLEKVQQPKSPRIIRLETGG